MAWQDWVTAQGLGSVDLPGNLLRLIAQVQHSPGSDHATAVARVVEYFVSGHARNAAEVDAAMTAAGVAPADVQREWDALWKRLQQALPERLRSLASPLKSLQKVAYPFVAAKGGGAIAGAPLPMSWKASADAQLAVEAMPAGALAAAGVGIKLDAGQIALRLGIDGALSASVSGKMVPTWGSIAVGAGADGASEFDLYAREPETRVLLDALLESAGAINIPGDLDSALAAAKDPTFGALKLGLRGSVFVSGSITAGYSASLAREGFTPGAPDLALEATLGAKLSARLQRKGAYTVVVVPAGNSVTLRVEQDRNLNQTAAIELGANVAVGGLAENLDPFLKQWLPDDAALVEEIEKYTNLRGLLNAEVGKIQWLQQQPIADALAQVLLGNLGAADVAAKANDWITARITDSIHGAVPWLTMPADQVAAKAAAALMREQGVASPGAAAAAIAALLAAPVAKAQKDVNDALAATLADLRHAVGAELATLLQPLARVGTDVNALIAAGQTTIAPLVEAVTGWLDQYMAFRKRILDAVAKAAEAQLALAFNAEYTRETTKATLFSATFVKSAPAARDLYRAAWMGRFDALSELLERTRDERSVVNPSGIVSSTFSTNFKVGVSFQLLGLSLFATRIAYTEVHIESDLAGRVLVVVGKDKLEEIRKWWKVEFDATLGINADLLKNVAAGDGNLPLSAAFSVKDEELHPDELANFVTTLTKHGMLSPTAGAGLYDRLAVNSSALPGFLRDVYLGVSFQLTNAEYQQLTRRDAEEAFDTAAPILYRLATTYLDDDDRLQQLLQRCRDKFGTSDRLAILRRIAATYPNSTAFHDDVVGVTGGSLLGGLRSAARVVLYAAKQAKGIADAVTDLHDAVVVANSGAGADIVGAKVDRLMRHAAQCLERSTQAVDQPIFPHDEIPWSTLGFYMTLGTLVGRNPPYGVTIDAVVPGRGDAAPRTFLIA